MLIRPAPPVLRSNPYAIPALIAAGLTVAAVRAGIYGLPTALGAAAVCFAIRMIGARFHLNAPGPLGNGRHHGQRGDHHDRDRRGDDQHGDDRGASD